MAAAPKPGSIAKEKRYDEIGTTEWTLSNGVRVLVKPTDFEADAVLVRGSSPGGLAIASAAQYPHARFADDLAALGGVGELDSEELRKLLAGVRASASAAIGPVTESINASASARDIETMFQLIHLRMTAPRKDDDAIAVWRSNFAESLADRERSPDYQFSVKSGEVLWQGHPRHAPPKPADIAKVDADQALAFYRDRFGDAADFTFVIVGAVDLAKLRPLVETYLASLPAKGRVEKERDLGARRVGGVVQKSFRLGQEPKARVSIQFLGDEPWTRDKERDLYVLGRVLSIRLREVLREDLGGVYGVSAGGFLARSPHQERVFTLSFGADPQRVDELIAAARKELAAIQKDGIGEEYLERVRKGFERERELQLKSNGFWAAWLESAARYGDDPRLVLDPAPMLARMTSHNVQAAARHYLDDHRYYQAIMLPAAPPQPPPQPPQQRPPQPPQQRPPQPPPQPPRARAAPPSPSPSAPTPPAARSSAAF
jgi:zinc protease